MMAINFLEEVDKIIQADREDSCGGKPRYKYSWIIGAWVLKYNPNNDMDLPPIVIIGR